MKRWLVLSALVLLAALLLWAATTGILRPVADGTTEQWTNNTGTSCASVSCFAEVNEVAGANCITLPGDATVNHSTATTGQLQFYDVDESSIPDNSTLLTAIVYVCARRGGTQNARGNLQLSINGTVTPCATTFASTATFTDFNCTIDFPDVTKTAATDFEIGLSNTQARDLTITTIGVDITYTAPPANKRRSQTVIARLRP